MSIILYYALILAGQRLTHIALGIIMSFSFKNASAFVATMYSGEKGIFYFLRS
jgi:hypothetical protein